MCKYLSDIMLLILLPLCSTPFQGRIQKGRVKRCVHWCQWFLRLVVAVRAMIVRVCFLIYSCSAVWVLVMVQHSMVYWTLLFTTLPMLVELLHEVYRILTTSVYDSKPPQRWFSPVILLFLISACPPIWFAEACLYDQPLANISINVHYPEYSSTTAPENYVNYEILVNHTSVSEALTVQPAENKAFFSNVATRLAGMNPTERVRVLEQILLLMLICGRWMLPREGMTRDQLSQLLLVNIGMAADILELFESFKEEVVRRDGVLVLSLLCLWQASLIQFCLTKTVTKGRKIRPGFAGTRLIGTSILDGVAGGEISDEDSSFNCASIFQTEIWAISSSLLLQDMPFLSMRLTLIISYKVVSYSNVFFTCKNTLVTLLQLFRIFVLFTETPTGANGSMSNNSAATLSRENDISNVHQATIPIEDLDCFNHPQKPPPQPLQTSRRYDRHAYTLSRTACSEYSIPTTVTLREKDLSNRRKRRTTCSSAIMNEDSPRFVWKTARLNNKDPQKSESKLVLAGELTTSTYV